MSVVQTRLIIFVTILTLIVGVAHSQEAEVAAEEEEEEVTAELVIEDFGTTGLGDTGSFGVGIGGLFEGTALLDVHIDFYVNPLIGIRLVLHALLPFAPTTVPTVEVAGDIMLGAIWRSYVVNRIRFYGGLMLGGGIAPFSDLDILLIPEGFGGFEFYVSPRTTIYVEFGGRSTIPLASLNSTPTRELYPYADGFFFRVGTNFGIK